MPNDTEMKTDSMYKGTKRFDREQLIFIADVMIAACVDAVEISLPQTPEDVTKNCYTADRIDGLRVTALVSLGWNLSILYAQLTGDGMGEGDALSIVKIEPHLDKLIKQRTDLKWKGFKTGQNVHDVDTRKLAEHVVEQFFDAKDGDYLRTGPAPKVDPNAAGENTPEVSIQFFDSATGRKSPVFGPFDQVDVQTISVIGWLGLNKGDLASKSVEDKTWTLVNGTHWTGFTLVFDAPVPADSRSLVPSGFKYRGPGSKLRFFDEETGTGWGMRIVETDNHGGDYPNESFLNLPSTSVENAKRMQKLINEIFCGEDGSRYWKVVHQEYKLQPGFEP